MGKETKILIVDDDAHSRTTLADLLTENEYKVITAADGKEALDKVNKKKPHVVLMDIRLPGLNGYELCRAIKKIEGSATKIILYTAYIDAVNVSKAKEAGADDFLGKTSGFSNLLIAVNNLLQ